MEAIPTCRCDQKILNLSNGKFHDLLVSAYPSCACKCHSNLLLNYNEIDFFPRFFAEFRHLTGVDIGHNNFSVFPAELCSLTSLRSIVAKCNSIEDDGLPEKMSLLVNLEKLDLCGNKLRTLGNQLTELVSLRELELGGNQLVCVSPHVRQLTRLELLYLGGNQLTEIPTELGQLSQLRVLSLADNLLRAIPSSLGGLRLLESLSLHRNLLNALPPAIVKLRRLRELSLRDNPLVRHFVRTFEWQVPSMLELAGRVVLQCQASLSLNDLPSTLHSYLYSAHRCANPRCGGVYFSSCVEHIKFKDFCGKFRMPLLAFSVLTALRDYPRH